MTNEEFEKMAMSMTSSELYHIARQKEKADLVNALSKVGNVFEFGEDNKPCVCYTGGDYSYDVEILKAELRKEHNGTVNAVRLYVYDKEAGERFTCSYCDIELGHLSYITDQIVTE
jgi:hypothetical protein